MFKVCLRSKLLAISFARRSLSLESIAAGIPHSVVNYLRTDMRKIKQSILQDLEHRNIELSECSKYQFMCTAGKQVRPAIICTLSRAVNRTSYEKNDHVGLAYEKQMSVAKIAEMIHTATLIHDDVVDESNTRRGKPTVAFKWGPKKAVLTGDYILAVASKLLADLRHPDVIILLAQVIEDLVHGEFAQIKAVNNGQPLSTDVAFKDYLERIYLKTASLFANSCKACAMLANASHAITDAAYVFGKNIGLTFQLVDDILDASGNEETMGKSTCLDLKFGFMTAPYLFAAQQFPEINELWRSQADADLNQIMELTLQACGLEKTRALAEVLTRQADDAIIQNLTESDERLALTKFSAALMARVR